MKRSSRQAQGGYALILFVLAIMGVGGVVLAGLTQGAKQQTDQQRYLHNQRVLEEAKAALLQYAYNYPVVNDIGPGRLPNADTDNDGISDGGSTFGRLPWDQPNLNLYDMRDADGQRLWYAVSSTFRPQATVVNSNTSGTLTVRAPSGGVMYDGSNADGLVNYGIAAVIIAPGAAIGRNGIAQDRSIANGDDPFDTTADTDAGIIDPVNYLDLIFGTEDNATVIQGDATDGFVLGRTGYRENDAVNDQLILITAEEVTRMAEKAVLEAYRAAIVDYQQNIWAASVGDYRYPWMNAYADITDLDVYDIVPGAGSRVGRVPFLNHEDHDSHSVFTPLSIDYILNISGLVDTADPFANGYMSAFDDLFLVAQNLDIPRADLSFKQETFDTAFDLSTDDRGTMIIDGDVIVTDGLNLGDIADGTNGLSQKVYLWDGCATCPEPEDGWEECPPGFGDERDCAKDSSPPYSFEAFTSWPNHADIKIRVAYREFRYFWDNLAGDGWELCDLPATDEEDCARNPGNTGFVPFTSWSDHADIQIRMVVFQHSMDSQFEIGLHFAIPSIPVSYTAPTATTNAQLEASLVPIASDINGLGELLTPGYVTHLGVDLDVGFTDALDFFNITVFCEEDRLVGSGYDTFWEGNPDGNSFYCTPNLNYTATLSQLDITADYYPELPFWVKRNNWNDSILMAYAPDYQPDSVSTPPNCGANPPCLAVTDNFDGIASNKAAVLLSAGRNPANPAELGTMFEGENSTPLDDIFSANPDDGDDSLLILNES